MVTLVSNHLPLVNYLKERFKPKPVRPSTPINDVMFSAGQQSVLEFLDAMIQEEEDQQMQFK